MTAIQRCALYIEIMYASIRDMKESELISYKMFTIGKEYRVMISERLGINKANTTAEIESTIRKPTELDTETFKRIKKELGKDLTERMEKIEEVVDKAEKINY